MAAWTRGPIIGRGSSAAVYLAATATGTLFAVKSADFSTSLSLQNEHHLITQLHDSPYVVKSLGSDTTTCDRNKHVYNLFLEYLPGGALSDHVRTKSLMNETAIKKHAFQILKGLSYIHGKGIVHCDVKGQNILVGDDGGLKIADFGCAKKMGFSGMSGFSGTPAYMSPEVARGEEQGFAADIWAFGCTVIEMATGSSPWPEMKDPAAAFYRIGFAGEVPEVPSWFSGEAQDFVAMCLMRDPRERWTAAELLQHPFLEHVDENCEEMIRESPTSVMDQGFWDSLEVPEYSENPSEIDGSLESPARRIRELVGDEAGFPAWTEEEWLTVRCNESDECSTVGLLFEDFHEDSIDEEFVTLFSVDDEDEIRSSILMEDYLLDYYCFDSRIVFPVRDSESVNLDFSLFGVWRNSENDVMLMDLLFLHQCRHIIFVTILHSKFF